MSTFFRELLQRRDKALQDLECVSCGAKDMARDKFEDELSWKEYSLSALCQACQDKVFGSE